MADANGSDEQMLLHVCQWVVPPMDFAGGGWWSIDDTGFPKQDNCQVAVSVSLACEAASVPAAWRLYLPPEWADDQARRDKAGVPEALQFATNLNWQNTSFSDRIQTHLCLAPRCLWLTITRFFGRR